MPNRDGIDKGKRKLWDKDINKDEEDPLVLWMEFLDAKSRGVMEMLAEKNKAIKKAYTVLEILSKDEKARMAYEAREAEVRDQLTRLKTAEEKGMEKGIEKGIEKIIMLQLEQRIKEIPSEFKQKISKLEEAQLEKIALNMVNIERLEDLAQYLQ